MDLVYFFNHDDMQLPLKYHEPGFLRFLTTAFASYKNLVEQISSQDQLSQQIIAAKNTIANLCDGILESIKRYLEGHTIESYKKLEETLEVVKTPHIDRLRPGNGKNVSTYHPFFYRMRKGGPDGYTREEMFHIPFEKRSIVETRRYSIPGWPCLYLGSSLHICWEELGCPDFRKIQVARLEWAEWSEKLKRQPLRILDFGYTPQSIASLINHCDQNEHKKNLSIRNCSDDPHAFSLVLSHAVCWPIIAASSVCVLKPKDTFKPEYIIPQQMLQWVVQTYKEVDAIRYISTKKEPNFRGGDVETNFVFPPKQFAASGHCPTLKSQFRMTDPISWHLLSTTDFPLSSDHPINSNQEIPLKSGSKIEYTSTEFWKNELKLNAMSINPITERSVQKMSQPMISVAGIRGIVGDSLIPEEFVKFAAAFASTLKNKVIVLGADTRPTLPMVRHLTLGACMACGCKVLDLGVVPTPTVGFMAKYLGAGGGIAITASHNPLQWNALKFFSANGVFLSRQEVDAVLERYRNSNFDYRPWNELGSVETVPNPTRAHLNKVLGAVDVALIKKAKFRVAIDLCNGAGAEILTTLLKKLDCEFTTVFSDPAKAFERVAEPLPENLGALGEAVRNFGASIGFAVDPDADRLALVDETGRPIGEERTLTLCARSVLQAIRLAGGTTTAPLVANLSTTRALDDVAAEFGTHVERTRIGEANVVERILETKAIIGGEGNGGIIYPTTHPGRDAATGIALLLQTMAVANQPLSVINAQVPDYVMVKDKVSIEGKDVATILTKLRAAFTDATSLDDTDGLKILFPDSWIHVRPSGTEPIVRVFAEAPTEASAHAKAQRAMDLVVQ
jgi:phosphomannomutase